MISIAILSSFCKISSNPTLLSSFSSSFSLYCVSFLFYIRDSRYFSTILLNVTATHERWGWSQRVSGIYTKRQWGKKRKIFTVDLSFIYNLLHINLFLEYFFHLILSTKEVFSLHNNFFFISKYQIKRHQQGPKDMRRQQFFQWLLYSQVCVFYINFLYKKYTYTHRKKKLSRDKMIELSPCIVAWKIINEWIESSNH